MEAGPTTGDDGTAEPRGAATLTGAAGGGLVLIYAHPDDETFSCAGVMAATTERGVPVTLISATRGEAGKTGDPSLDTPEILGMVREQELRAAAAAVGVVDIRFLDYRDSGMAGTPENDDPRAFARAPEAEVVAKLVVHLRAIRPETVVTFGADGIYGHPDHLAIHRAATAAVAAAADERFRPSVGSAWQTPYFYYSTAPRERLQAMAARPDGPLRDVPPEDRAKLGTPLAEITTIVDIRPYADVKLRAIAAHRTQTGEGGPLEDMSEERRELFVTREHFVRVPLGWDDRAVPGEDLVGRLPAASAMQAAVGAAAEGG